MPTLGYWKIRGLAAGIRMQMIYQGVEYDLAEYEQGDGPEFSRDAWYSVKPTMGLDFPNLPYFINGDFRITETVAIHKYIADKWNPEVLGTTPEERARVNMLHGVILDFKNAVTRPCYTSGNRDEIIPIIQEKLPAIVNFLGENQFLAGNNVTWVDFFFFEFVNAMRFIHEGLFAEFPSIEAYHARMSDLPRLKEYLADPNSLDNNRTFNNKVAKLNNIV